MLLWSSLFSLATVMMLILVDLRHGASQCRRVRNAIFMSVGTIIRPSLQDSKLVTGCVPKMIRPVDIFYMRWRLTETQDYHILVSLIFSLVPNSGSPPRNFLCERGKHRVCIFSYSALSILSRSSKIRGKLAITTGYQVSNRP